MDSSNYTEDLDAELTEAEEQLAEVRSECRMWRLAYEATTKMLMDHELTKRISVLDRMLVDARRVIAEQGRGITRLIREARARG